MRAVVVVARELGEKRRARSAVEVAAGRGATRSVSRRSQKLPGRPHEVPLERGVGGGVGARELGVELVDDAAHLGERAVDLLARRAATSGGTSRRSFGREHLEHRVERLDAPPERLRLRELDEHAAPRAATTPRGT